MRTRPTAARWLSVLALAALGAACGEEDDAHTLPGDDTASVRITGAESASLDYKGDQNFIRCTNVASGVFVRAAAGGTDDASSEAVTHLDIDLFGAIGPGAYTAVPETDSTTVPARGFRIFYHPAGAQPYYVNQDASQPCTLSASDATSARLSLTFECKNLEHSDTAGRAVSVSGTLECARR